MVSAKKDMLRGSSDPSVVQTYQTKSFKNEGVTGSEQVKRLNETKESNAITPDVLKMGKGVAKSSGMKTKPLGEGMPKDSGKFKK